MKIHGKLGILPCIPCWQMLLLLLTGEVVIESGSWCCGLHVFRRTRSLLVICVWFGECSMTDGHVCVSKLAPTVRCCCYCSPAFPFHFCFPLASFHIQLFSVPGIILLMSTKVCRCGATPPPNPTQSTHGAVKDHLVQWSSRVCVSVWDDNFWTKWLSTQMLGVVVLHLDLSSRRSCTVVKISSRSSLSQMKNVLIGVVRFALAGW